MEHSGEGDHCDVEELRQFVRRLVEQSSIRATARTLELTSETVRRFIDGEWRPYGKTLFRISRGHREQVRPRPPGRPDFGAGLVPLSPAETESLFHEVAGWGVRDDGPPDGVADISPGSPYRMHLEWRKRWRRDSR